MNNTMTTFYIVRHGQSEGNANFESGKTTIRTDLGTELTELGKQQASLIAKRFKNHHFDAVFSSDLTRARQTAESLALEHNLAVTTTKALRERDKGSINVESEKEIRAQFKELYDEYEKMTDEQKFNFKVVPDMESQGEAVNRFITYLRELAVGYSGKSLLIISHGNIMRSLLVKLGYGTFKEFPGGSIENTGYIVLESDGVDFFIKETHGVHKKVTTDEE
jgi:broad specificity phosphatase PhoE